MAVKSKRTQLGNYIRKVNNYDIRQKVSYSKVVGRGENKHPQVASSEYVVCKGKRTVKVGFNSLETASKYAESN